MTETLPPQEPKPQGSLLLEVLDGKLPTVVEPTETVKRLHKEVQGE
jgi:hypothetical protein